MLGCIATLFYRNGSTTDQKFWTAILITVWLLYLNELIQFQG